MQSKLRQIRSAGFEFLAEALFEISAICFSHLFHWLRCSTIWAPIDAASQRESPVVSGYSMGSADNSFCVTTLTSQLAGGIWFAKVEWRDAVLAISVGQRRLVLMSCGGVRQFLALSTVFLKADFQSAVCWEIEEFKWNIL